MRVSPLSLPALLALAACAGSPQPIPPPEIDASLLSIDVGADGVVVSGAAGAATHASQILAVDLGFGAGEPSLLRVAVAVDGSFAATFADAAADDTFRLHATITGPIGPMRSAPIDIALGDGGDVVEPPRSACVLVDRAMVELTTAPGSKATATVALANDCAGPIDVAYADLRIPAAGWQLGGEQAPYSLEPQNGRTYTLAFEPLQAGDDDAVLVLGIQIAGVGELHPVTLFGLGQ